MQARSDAPRGEQLGMGKVFAEGGAFEVLARTADADEGAFSSDSSKQAERTGPSAEQTSTNGKVRRRKKKTNKKPSEGLVTASSDEQVQPLQRPDRLLRPHSPNGASFGAQRDDSINRSPCNSMDRWSSSDGWREGAEAWPSSTRGGPGDSDGGVARSRGFGRSTGPACSDCRHGIGGQSLRYDSAEPFPQGQGPESFSTPLHQSPSFEDANVNQFRTPAMEAQVGGDKAATPTPRMKEWENQHSKLGPVEAAFVPVDGSIVQHLWKEVFHGFSSPGDARPTIKDPKRERVYNTMFHVPWRCEMLLGIGFLVCLDSFLSLFSVLPVRLLLLALRMVRAWSHKKAWRFRADEMCDLLRVTVLVLGVGLLLQADVSLIYHWIRGQAIIKLYVVYNVLEILDKLCQSFGADVLQVVFNMAERVAICPPRALLADSLRLLLDASIALACFLFHGLIIMSHAVTLNVAINSHSNALLTLLVSNNFTEVKGNVFKRMAPDNVHKMAYLDTVERFHISSCLVFVLVQNIIKGEASLLAFYKNAAMVVCCEVVVDLLKHAFMAKFNEIQPEAYSGFLRSLCRQTLESRSHNIHRTMSFVPLSPACVVIRGLLPLFFSALPRGPRWWRWSVGSAILLACMALVTLVKALLGVALQLHARWYLLRSLSSRRRTKTAFAM